MPLFRRRARPGQVRRAESSDVAHLTAFARSHTGVEAFVEPPTAVSTTTVVFVANTGEWTRRRVQDARAAHELGQQAGRPVLRRRRRGLPAADAGLERPQGRRREAASS